MAFVAFWLAPPQLAPAGTASAVPVFLALVASAIDFAPAPGLAARPPIKYYFAARGPPEDI
jgi:hypothetical protein